MSINWFKYSSPASFYGISRSIIKVASLIAIILCIIGLYWGFAKTPNILTDQKEYYRILFVHVPVAWMSMWLYVTLVFWAVIGLIFNTRLSYMMAAATAPTGALFAFLTIWTGAFWGKTSWGVWWDWDPRMTSMLILLFIYIGYIALQNSITDTRRADRASALLALVGVICIPVIYLSINCPDPYQCAALHQQSSLKKIENNILIAMFIMLFATWAYSFAVITHRLRSIILEREKRTQWAQDIVRDTA